MTGSRFVLSDLRGADLKGANLTDADLSGANLSDADLRGATLYFAILGRIKLMGPDGKRSGQAVATNLSGANLQGVDLSHVDLSRANLAGAKLDPELTTGGRV